MTLVELARHNRFEEFEVAQEASNFSPTASVHFSLHPSQRLRASPYILFPLTYFAIAVRNSILIKITAVRLRLIWWGIEHWESI